MLLRLGIQFEILFYAIVSGMLIGLSFDFYKIVRGNSVPKIILFIEDILFFSLCAIIIFTFLLYYNYAFMGPYVYVFILIAIIFYFKFISSFISRIEVKLFEFICKKIRVGIKNILYPFKLFLSKISIKK